MVGFVGVGGCGVKENTIKPKTAAEYEVTSSNNTTGSLINQAKYQEGLELAKKTLQYAEQQLGKQHPDTLVSVQMLALLYQIQGHPKEAESLHLRVINSLEATLGRKHPDTLNAVRGLAFLYYEQSLFEEAESLHLHVLNSREF